MDGFLWNAYSRRCSIECFGGTGADGSSGFESEARFCREDSPTGSDDQSCIIADQRKFQTSRFRAMESSLVHQFVCKKLKTANPSAHEAKRNRAALQEGATVDSLS